MVARRDFNYTVIQKITRHTNRCIQPLMLSAWVYMWPSCEAQIDLFKEQSQGCYRYSGTVWTESNVKRVYFEELCWKLSCPSYFPKPRMVTPSNLSIFCSSYYSRTGNARTESPYHWRYRQPFRIFLARLPPYHTRLLRFFPQIALCIECSG